MLRDKKNLVMRLRACAECYEESSQRGVHTLREHVCFIYLIFFVWHMKAVMLCANYHENLVVLYLGLGHMYFGIFLF